VETGGYRFASIDFKGIGERYGGNYLLSEEISDQERCAQGVASFSADTAAVTIIPSSYACSPRTVVMSYASHCENERSSLGW
jgi:hypothetical protein